MSEFIPHLEILPPPQRRLWDELSFVPREFVLYGGTALALHLGHRDSVDFDFFSNRQLDLAGTKASVVQVRAEMKDYVDLDALMTTGGIGLPEALAAAKALRGPGFNPEITLKALSYFEDGNLTLLPDDVKHRLVAAVAAVDLEHLPGLDLDLGDDLSL